MTEAKCTSSCQYMIRYKIFQNRIPIYMSQGKYIIWSGDCKTRNKTKRKQNKQKRNETKRDTTETKQDKAETKRSESRQTKSSKIKKNETNNNETISIYMRQ